MSKYHALTKHLSSRNTARVVMSFAEVETILGAPLPKSARNYRPWWANSGHGHVQARGWLDAGYQSEQVDLEAERLIFTRLNAVEAPTSGQPPIGDHPLFGCMSGSITLPGDIDLTEPSYADPEMAEILDQNAALLSGHQS
jgi:hypothetical protein